MENTDSIRFICLGSSSSGNCYIFQKGSECVMVECGFDFKKIASMMMDNDVFVSDIKAVVVTHCHNDHAKAIENFVIRGVECYIPSTIVSVTRNTHLLEADKRYKLTDWLSMIPFKVEHDTEAYGFMFLDTTNNESILFINDTKCFDFPYKNIGFDYIFIECNHIRKQLEVVMQNALNNHKQGEVFKYKRQSAFHMSLAGCKKFLSLMNLKKTKGIFLMHLSKDLCNDVIVKTEIQNTFGIKTFVCHRQGGIG